MNPSEYNALHILHVFGAIGLVASVFYACAAAPETRGRLLKWSGCVALIVLLTGGRMWQKIYHLQDVWIWVKLFCWVGISALAGFAYRKREKAGLWIALSLAFAAIALVMVYAKPF
jgi:hypothetical protein